MRHDLSHRLTKLESATGAGVRYVVSDSSEFWEDGVGPCENSPVLTQHQWEKLFCISRRDPLQTC